MGIHTPYFYWFVGFFIIEVLIALFIQDSFIRPYLGDTFVVILLYCLVRSFLDLPPYPVIIGVLLFSYTVEVMQYFKLVDLLGLGDYQLARVIIGTSFAWGDLVAYTAGALIIVAVEYVSFSSGKKLRGGQ